MYNINNKKPSNWNTTPLAGIVHNTLLPCNVMIQSVDIKRVRPGYKSKRLVSVPTGTDCQSS